MGNLVELRAFMKHHLLRNAEQTIQVLEQRLGSIEGRNKCSSLTPSDVSAVAGSVGTGRPRAPASAGVLVEQGPQSRLPVTKATGTSTVISMTPSLTQGSSSSGSTSSLSLLCTPRQP